MGDLAFKAGTEQRIFSALFEKYSSQKAPFLHQQYVSWSKTRPLEGLRILHHVPLVQNTLLKIACLIAAGAEVTVTNPQFMSPCKIALRYLSDAKIKFAADFCTLRGETFDIYLDCGAELYQTLAPPQIGAIELTGTGDQYYLQNLPDFPVVSIDRSLTKQLETIFGTAESAVEALEKMTNASVTQKTWMIFGFGKIGRGLAYSCARNGNPFFVVDVTDAAKTKSAELNIHYIDARDHAAIEAALSQVDVVIAATGKEAVMSAYPKKWFEGKILASMGVLDEFGKQFSLAEILNQKSPVNFMLDDPTPIEYIDPELFAHNEVIIDLLNTSEIKGVRSMQKKLDDDIIQRWCQYHAIAADEIQKWFIQF